MAPRWTVSHKTTSICALCMGLGFASVVVDAIRAELQAGTLRPLLMRESGERFTELYLVFVDRDLAVRDARRLAEVIRSGVESQCIAYRKLPAARPKTPAGGKPKPIRR